MRLIALLLLISSWVGSRAEAGEASNKARGGKLVVLSTTAGADIFIDDRRVGAVPSDRPLKLAVGSHTVRLELRGYATVEKVVKIRRGRTRKVEIDLLAHSGVVMVETAGITAEVVIDGKPLGPTPFDGEVVIGPRMILVRAPGYKPFASKLLIKGGQLYPLSVDLEVDPLAERPAGPDVAAWSLPAGWYKDPWVLATAGAMVVGAAAAMWLSGDPEARPPRADHTLKIGPGYE